MRLEGDCLFSMVDSDEIRPTNPEQTSEAETPVASGNTVTAGSGQNEFPGPLSQQTRDSESAQRPSSSSIRLSSSGITKPRSRAGRPAAIVRSLFDKKMDPTTQKLIGSECLSCQKLVKDQTLNATLLVKHVMKCDDVPYEKKILVWQQSSAARKQFSEPIPVEKTTATKALKTVALPNVTHPPSDVPGRKSNVSCIVCRSSATRRR